LNRPRSIPFLAIALCALSGCTDRGDDLTGGTPDADVLPFRSAATCGGCHPQHLEEWKASMHAYADSDPVMRKMAEIAASEPGGSIGSECFACHAPARVRQESWLASLPPTANPLVEDLSMDGVTCDVCHSSDSVPPGGSIDFLPDVDPSGPKLAGLRNPAPNSFHESAHDNSFTTSVTCAPCHQVNLDDGSGLENTFREWSDSNLSGQGIECQACHMPAYAGPAATGGPLRPDLHRHTFTGVDYALTDFRGIDRDAQKQAIRELLQGAVRVAVTGVPTTTSAGASFSFDVSVENHNSGHSIPSGTSFAREMWIAITVRDASGAIYRSGYLEANGDLVAASADPDLEFFGSTMRDASGNPTFFSWRAASIDESLLLPFGFTRTATYTVDVPIGAVGPLTVEMALNFRPMDPRVIRAVELDELLPIEIFEMWSDERTVAVTSAPRTRQ
jgi:hypothetical protein